MSDQSQSFGSSGSRSTSQTGSEFGDPNWSGVSSGAEGAMPEGAEAAGSTGGSGGASEFGGSTGSSQTGSESSATSRVMDAMPDQVKEQADKVISTAAQKASDLTDQATTTADAGIEKAAAGLDTLANTVRERSQSMGGGQLESVATAAADRLASGAEMLRGQSTEQLMTELEALVRRKPVESLLVAAGVGFVLSRALR